MSATRQTQVSCTRCGREFQHSRKFRDLLQKIALGGHEFPLPSSCPSCRRRTRQAWQNEKTLYRRHCDLSHKPTIAIYPPNTDFPVYSHESWISDGWDALEYGLELNLERSFFLQFRQLQKVVPRKAQNLISCENCDFNNNLWYGKNAYLSFMSSYLVDCYYDYASWDVKDSIEVWYSKYIELSHTIVASENLYGCIDCERCFHSDHLYFCNRLTGCSHCFGCYGLKQKKFCIFNEPVSETEYWAFLKAAELGSAAAHKRWREKFRSFLSGLPRDAVIADDFSEDYSGNYLFRTARSENCFVATDVEDCAWLFESARTKDCADLDFSYSTTLCYDSASAIGCHQSAFLDNCQDCSDSYYLSQCAHCTNCFGCIGLRRQSFCILNRQYSEAEYHEKVAALIAAMSKRDEWGEFFPIELSDFGYNQTEAALNMPLSKAEAIAAGANWSDYEAPIGVSLELQIDAADLPDHVRDADASILQKAIRCETTGRLFRIIAKELAFHQAHGVPLPRVHPLERYRALIAPHGGTELKPVRCASCGTECESVYANSSEQPLVCRPCFTEWLDRE